MIESSKVQIVEVLELAAPLNFKHVRKAFTLGLEVKAAVHDWFWEPSGHTKKVNKKKHVPKCDI